MHGDTDKLAVVSRFPPMISPYSKLRSSWDVLMLVLIVYSAFAVPFRLAFFIDPDGVDKHFEQFVDALFWLDILLNFRTG